MARKRVAVEFGMGTDLRGQDYTKAAERALRDALWHNSLTVARAFGFQPEEMIVEVDVAVTHPDQVDTDHLKSVLPYGQVSVSASQGGLDILSDDGSKTTVMANAAVVVYLDFPDMEAAA